MLVVKRSPRKSCDWLEGLSDEYGCDGCTGKSHMIARLTDRIYDNIHDFLTEVTNLRDQVAEFQELAQVREQGGNDPTRERENKEREQGGNVQCVGKKEEIAIRRLTAEEMDSYEAMTNNEFYEPLRYLEPNDRKIALKCVEEKVRCILSLPAMHFDPRRTYGFQKMHEKIADMDDEIRNNIISSMKLQLEKENEQTINDLKRKIDFLERDLAYAHTMKTVQQLEDKEEDEESKDEIGLSDEEKQALLRDRELALDALRNELKCDFDREREEMQETFEAQLRDRDRIIAELNDKQKVERVEIALPDSKTLPEPEMVSVTVYKTDELEREVDAMKTENDALKRELEAVRNRLEFQEEEMRRLESRGSDGTPEEQISKLSLDLRHKEEQMRNLIRAKESAEQLYMKRQLHVANLVTHARSSLVQEIVDDDDLLAATKDELRIFLTEPKTPQRTSSYLNHFETDLQKMRDKKHDNMFEAFPERAAIPSQGSTMFGTHTERFDSTTITRGSDGSHLESRGTQNTHLESRGTQNMSIASDDPFMKSGEHFRSPHAEFDYTNFEEDNDFEGADTEELSALFLLHTEHIRRLRDSLKSSEREKEALRRLAALAEKDPDLKVSTPEPRDDPRCQNTDPVTIIRPPHFPRYETTPQVAKTPVDYQEKIDQYEKELKAKQDEVEKLLILVEELRLRISSFGELVSGDAIEILEKVGLRDLARAKAKKQVKKIFVRLWEDALCRLRQREELFRFRMAALELADFRQKYTKELKEMFLGNFSWDDAESQLNLDLFLEKFDYQSLPQPQDSPRTAKLLKYIAKSAVDNTINAVAFASPRKGRHGQTADSPRRRRGQTADSPQRQRRDHRKHGPRKNVHYPKKLAEQVEKFKLENDNLKRALSKKKLPGAFGQYLETLRDSLSRDSMQEDSIMTATF